MVKFNHFSIVEKTFDEKVREFAALGFHFDNLSEKEIFKKFLTKAPVDEMLLQAGPSLSLTDFFTSHKTLDWEIFWTVSLQLQDFLVNFDFQAGQAVDFAKSVNLPMVNENELNRESLISALYLLLLSRRKNGMILIEHWVSEGFLPMDNAFHFFNDKSLATFNPADIKREVLWVESTVDTENKGAYDLIKIQIHRPFYKGKLPVVMTASPYHLGINVSANDSQLHKMEGNLVEKKEGKIALAASSLKLPNYEKVAVLENEEAEITFSHGWTSSLNDYLLARGFASIYVAGVGTQDSDGFQTSGDYQQVYSMTAVIDWLNGRARAFTSRRKDKEVKAAWANGKVAMTGKSYLGTMSYGAATTGIDGLEVIVAESGISSWYNYYREGGLVRSPGGFPGEDLDVLAQLTYSRDLSGADYLANHQHYQKELDAMTAALSRPTGDYNQYWEERNYLPNVKNVKADVLVVHGLQDWNVTPDQAYHYWKALPKSVVKHAFLHRGAHIYMNNWQSIDFSETINTYFTSKLLSRPLNLKLPPIILQENGKEQAFEGIKDWGSREKTAYPLGRTEASFENHYDNETFMRYAKDFEAFKKELFDGRANAVCLNLEIPENITINGEIRLNLKVKVNDTKAILSAQVLDFGKAKRLSDTARVKELKALDRGRNFQYEDLAELPLVDSPYQPISKGFLNLQNREGLLTLSPIRPNQWMNFQMILQPTIYHLEKGQKLRLLLYSTDFEHTIRDNRECSYHIDLTSSEIILPY